MKNKQSFSANKKLFLDILAIVILTILGIILIKTQILSRLGMR